MPFVTVITTQAFNAAQKKALLQASSDTIQTVLKAPVESIRITLHEVGRGDYICAGSFDAPMVLFDIDLIEGRSEAMKAELIAELSRVAEESLGVSQEHVRTRLCDFPSMNMGMAYGKTAKQAGR
ncbi:MAG TPA: tautomerase family protein [Burkholderiaceae bacterium]|nr:tautomerase family protein [Burkholderiaceae bacterium]